MRPFDPAFARSQFPAFSEPSLEGWAFFENAGGSFACSAVVERLAAFYRRLKVQPYAAYPASAEGGRWMDESLRRLARWLNVGVDELHVGPSTTQNTYVLAQAFRQTLRPGDEIVVTDQDHEANSGAWRRLGEEGFVIREWRIDPDSGHLDPDALPPLLSERTRVVCFPHASNVVAEINPVARIAALARSAGAVTVCDGVSYAPHGLPDVAALDADIYLFSTYKTFGPHQGVMTIRRPLADQLRNQGHAFNAVSRTKRFTPAGPDHAQVAALGGVVDYLEALADAHAIPAEGRTAALHNLIRAREAALAAPLLDYVAFRRDLRLIGPKDPARRCPTVAVHHVDRTGREIAEALLPDRIMADGGAFYADRCIRALGIDPAHGVARFSFLHYTTEEEVSRLIEALDRTR